MRLLIFSSEFPPGPGGIGTHAFQVAQELVNLGWQVQVLTPQDYAAESEIAAFNALSPFPIQRLQRKANRAAQSLYQIRELLAAVGSFQPELLLASGENAVYLSAFAQGFPPVRRLPRAAVWHGSIQPNPSMQRLARWCYSRADAVISVSRYSQERLAETGARLKKSYIIHNGADAQYYMPLSAGESEAFRRRFAADGSQILLTVGNVTERKGQEVVIRALPQILTSQPNVQYWMAGLPTLQAKLEKLAGELGVSAHIHFLGRLDNTDLRAAYNACDIFLMTSRHSRDGQFEGFGIAAIEAALCGKPAVVSDNSGLVEAILPGETGLVARENDPESTAEAILQLLEDPALRQRMGEQAQRRALGEQTWAASAAQYDRVLREVLASFRSRQAE